MKHSKTARKLSIITIVCLVFCGQINVFSFSNSKAEKELKSMPEHEQSEEVIIDTTASSVLEITTTQTSTTTATSVSIDVTTTTLDVSTTQFQSTMSNTNEFISETDSETGMIETTVNTNDLSNTVNTDVKENHLTKQSGTSVSPGGEEETWYDLNMNGVVLIMRNIGYSEEEYPYWIDSKKGTKMFGPYIMVGADLNLTPKGTIVETTLGSAIVCDTGNYTNHFDIAVDWKHNMYPGFNC